MGPLKKLSGNITRDGLVFNVKFFGGTPVTDDLSDPSDPSNQPVQPDRPANCNCQLLLAYCLLLGGRL
jgi:hypothetical protein